MRDARNYLCIVNHIITECQKYENIREYVIFHNISEKHHIGPDPQLTIINIIQFYN